jgi:hypothetical protein
VGDPPATTRPLRVFSHDESRSGFLTVRRRRLTARGVQPVGSVPHVFAWFSVCGAVEPTTGERFFLQLLSIAVIRSCKLRRQSMEDGVTNEA